MVTERLADQRPKDHAALVAALSLAAEWCDDATNAEELASYLGAAPYLNLPARVILPALIGEFDCGQGRVERVPEFLVFHRGGTNVPSVGRAENLQQEISGAGLLPAGIDRDLPSRLFREDLYLNALKSKPTYESVATS
jgi:ABC-type nitrate/sulfonate/bicarbonate transport system substrate-binding protein